MIRLLTFLSYCLNLLPLFIVQTAGRGLGWIAFHIIGFRKQIVLKNLALAFSSDRSESEIHSLAEEIYCHYGMTLLECFQTVSWDAERFRDRILVQGLENIQPFLRKGEGGFFLASHMGNWETAIHSVAAHGVPLDVVVKQPENGLSHRFLDWYRRRAGARIFYQEGSMGEILKSVREGRFVGFILDQFMGPPIGLPVKFFGQTAGTAAALALLSEKTGAPVVPVFSYRSKNGLLHTLIERPLEFPALASDRNTRLYQRTQSFNDAMERQIRRYPAQWLWIHRRWKPYIGVPRWASPLLLCLLFILISCTTPGSQTPTGIALPPDPPITVPDFKPVEQDSAGSPPPQAQEADTTASQNTKPVIKTENKPVKNPKKPASLPKKKEEPFTLFPLDQIPFAIGERMEFDLYWTALPAGKVVLEIREGRQFNGRPTFLLWGNVLSSKLVDTVYHVDNTIESYIDRSGLLPYKFLLHMVETHQMKETRVAFDHQTQKAYYWSKRLSQKWGNEDQDRVDAIALRTQDMFSALYFARAQNYKLKQKVSVPVYENKQNLEVELNPIANELVQTAAGTFQCWKLDVSVKLNNVLSPTGQMHMWLSDDSKRYLVKFDSKLKIGSLYGNLVNVREHQ